MKKFLTTILLLAGLLSFAQPPRGVNYQAVVRNAAGQPYVNTPVSLKFIIHDGSALGASVFNETIDTATNAFGLVNLKIGATNDLSTVNWASGDKYLQVESDVNHTGTYSDLGTAQLLSVPYAFYSGTTNNPNQWQKNGSNIYYNNGNVGIGIDTPKAPLHIKNGSVVFEGENVTTQTPVSGPGTRMMWYSNKGAFRTGTVYNNIWDADSIGIYSFAAGNQVKALSEYTVAMGIGSSATERSAIAMGEYSNARDENTVAIGGYSDANGYRSIAVGSYNSATGDDANAIGNNNTASYYATALGVHDSATGNTSLAVGNYCKAFGDYAAAIGDGITASGRGSFGAGFQSTAGGDYSVVAGASSTASGGYSVAIGNANSADGYASQVLGQECLALGVNATAIGIHDTAYSDYSAAIGNANFSGTRAMTFGQHCKASGTSSTAMGNYVSTNGYTGSFIIGDYSNTLTYNDAADQMKMRFSGGYKLYTNTAATIGASMATGANSWATMSDRRIKENLAPTNGEEFLKKISAFKLYSWNYIGQDPKAFRHYGPMAQDFYAAFGKDAYGTIGNDTTIAQSDFEGVSFVAIQALEKRTSELTSTLQKRDAELSATQKQLQQQQQLVDMLVKKNEALEKRMVKLEK